MRTIKQKRFMYSQKEFYQKEIQKLDDIEQRVVRLLSENEHLRNCDICLVFSYWQEVDKCSIEDLKQRDNLHTLTSFESIRRVRQNIQNTIGFWPPTNEDTINARRIKQKIIEQWAGRQRDIFNNTY